VRRLWRLDRTAPMTPKALRRALRRKANSGRFAPGAGPAGADAAAPSSDGRASRRRDLAASIGLAKVSFAICPHFSDLYPELWRLILFSLELSACENVNKEVSWHLPTKEQESQFLLVLLLTTRPNLPPQGSSNHSQISCQSHII
jgi:hypothetical protein